MQDQPMTGSRPCPSGALPCDRLKDCSAQLQSFDGHSRPPAASSEAIIGGAARSGPRSRSLVGEVPNKFRAARARALYRSKGRRGSPVHPWSRTWTVHLQVRFCVTSASVLFSLVLRIELKRKEAIDCRIGGAPPNGCRPRVSSHFSQRRQRRQRAARQAATTLRTGGLLRLRQCA